MSQNAGFSSWRPRTRSTNVKIERSTCYGDYYSSSTGDADGEGHRDHKSRSFSHLARTQTAVSGCLRTLSENENFHCHMRGPHFRDYHLLLDEQATQIFAMTDVIAERTRKLGATTLHSIGDISNHQRLNDNNAEIISTKEMLAELRADSLQLT